MRRAMVCGIVFGDAGQFYISLRSKSFRFVSEQRKTEERDFRFWPREKRNKSQKMKEGGGDGKEGRKQTSKRTKNAEKACSQATSIVLGTFMS